MCEALTSAGLGSELVVLRTEYLLATASQGMVTRTVLLTSMQETTFQKDYSFFTIAIILPAVTRCTSTPEPLEIMRAIALPETGDGALQRGLRTLS